MFVCQSCHRGLKVDSAGGLSGDGALARLARQINEQNKNKKEQQALEQLGESFVVLPSKSPRVPSSVSSPSSGSLDRQVSTLTGIFEIAAEKAGLDFPLCGSCADGVCAELERKVKEAESDKLVYVEQIRALKQAAPPPQQLSQQEITALADKENQLERKLEQLKADRAALSAEGVDLERDVSLLDSLERAFWADYQDYQIKCTAVNEEQTFMKQQLEAQGMLLDKMKRTNVYDDAFHISYDGHFGTINGFRLGRLPSQPVDWAETNAALGQVVLLLHTIAKQAQFSFSKYKLIPMGSFSKMARLDDLSTTHELYGSNDLNLGRLFWYRRFDTALVWLLACIRELGDYASLVDHKFKLRYTIKGDLIGEQSIKLQFNNDAKWTKALKYMLTNLKFLLVWCSKRRE